jgi:RNA processing factor Prp31
LIQNFASRFVELASIITAFENFAQAAKQLTQNEILTESTFLSKQQLTSLELSFVHGFGDPISDPSFLRECDLQIETSSFIEKYLKISEKGALEFVPNLSSLIEPEIVVTLFSIAGGLRELLNTPACDIKNFGSKNTGNLLSILYKSAIIQQVQPDFRESAFKDLANKIVLAARIAFSGESKEKIFERIEKRLKHSIQKVSRSHSIPGNDKKEKRELLKRNLE